MIVTFVARIGGALEVKSVVALASISLGLHMEPSQATIT